MRWDLQMAVKTGVKNIQATAYNGACMLFKTSFLLIKVCSYKRKRNSWTLNCPAGPKPAQISNCVSKK